MTEACQRSRRVIVLGSTGSIGVSTIEVVAHLRDTAAVDIKLVGLASGRRAARLAAQARAFGVAAVAIADPAAAADLRASLPDATVFSGPDAARDMVRQVEATDVCAAMVGSAGLPATIEAIRGGLDVCLANKETLVAAGALVAPLARRHGSRLVPVDSEHSAIYQCLNGEPRAHLRRIVLTASGGPFRCVEAETMADATVEQALLHPTWKMGPKITIDSATMMNKALEVVEAHWLFDLPAGAISVIIHPQSIIHSFVEFEDNAILAQLGPPDMRTPIQYALTGPQRPAGCSQRLDWSTLGKLEFEDPDPTRFPAVGLAYDVIRAGGTAGAVFNAANEAAVAAFLERRVRFGRIVELVAEALAAIDVRPIADLASILDADQRARRFVTDHIARAKATTPASALTQGLES